MSPADSRGPSADPRVTRLTGFSDGEPTTSHPPSHDETYRGPFERDVDRIQYTPFFRRLKDVTQVARADEAYLYHDRLTHSLKVAQVGKRLTQHLLRRRAEPLLDGGHGSGSGQASNDGSELPAANPERSLALAQRTASQALPDALAAQLNPKIVEAACLAHDLGHPPFGHVAEDELDQLLIEHTHPAVNHDLDWDCDWRLSTLPEPAPDADGWSVDDLDAWARASGDDPHGLRFEGNAQSFRILTRLASHSGSNTGLGLTLASLAAVQKYPYERGQWITGDDGQYRPITTSKSAIGARDSRSDGKFGCYTSEAAAFARVRTNLDCTHAPTLAADIMDYADDATYAVHDLIDFYKYDQIPLHRLLRQAYEGYAYDEPIELNTVIASIDPLTDGPTVEETLRFLASEADSISTSLFRPFQGTPEQQQAVQALSATLIELFIDGNDDFPDQLAVVQPNGTYRLADRKGKFTGHIHTLQELTKYYVITDTALAGQQLGQRRIIRELFDVLYAEATDGDLKSSAIPELYVDWFGDGTDREETARAVADVISSMTERQVLQLYQRLTGDSPGSLVDQIVG